MTIKTKLASKGGFSFLEMILTCIIMVLVSTLVTDAMILGLRVFRRRTSEDAADLLLNELCVYVQDELSRAVKLNDADITLNLDANTRFRGSAGYPCQLRAVNGQIVSHYWLGTNEIDVPFQRSSSYNLRWVSLKEDISYRYNTDYNWFTVTIALRDANELLPEKKRLFVVLPIRNADPLAMLEDGMIPST